MDFSQSTKVVFQRIQELDAKNVSKIMGTVLLNVTNERDMVRLAFCDDMTLQSLVDRVKIDLLGLSPQPPNISNNDTICKGKGPLLESNLSTNFTPFTPASSSSSYKDTRYPFPAPENGHCYPQNIPMGHDQFNFGNNPMVLRDPSTRMYMTVESNHPQQFMHMEQINHHMQPPSFVQADPNYNMQPQNIGFSDLHRPITATPHQGQNPRPDDQRSGKSPDLIFPKHYLSHLTMQICEYYKRGFCKHGADCRLLHVQDVKNGYVMVVNPNESNEVDVYGKKCLKRLEKEIIGILKSRRGVPVAIASLPILYHEMYGRILDAEAYLTPGQGTRGGCVLTHLVSKMTEGIRLLDRPHGKRSIILDEDIPLYRTLMERISEECISDEIDSSQIYITFLPSSSLNQEDVFKYFMQFGHVRNVRIPFLKKRMFGFVSFFYPETVVLILSIRNPHIITGTQVLVKPYRSKDVYIEIRRELLFRNYHPRLPQAESRINTAAPRPRVHETQKVEEEHQKPPVDDKGKSKSNTNLYGHVSILKRRASDDGCSPSGSKDESVKKTCENNGESFEELNLPENPFDYF